MSGSRLRRCILGVEILPQHAVSVPGVGVLAVLTPHLRTTESRPRRSGPPRAVCRPAAPVHTGDMHVGHGLIGGRHP